MVDRTNNLLKLKESSATMSQETDYVILQYKDNKIAAIGEDGTVFDLTISTFEALTDVGTINERDVVLKQGGVYTGLPSENFDSVLFETEIDLSADQQLPFSLPAKYSISNIRIKETSNNAAGNVSIGSTSGGTDIVNAVTVGAQADLRSVNGGITIAKQAFSDSADMELWISSSAWGSGVVDVKFKFELDEQ